MTLLLFGGVSMTISQVVQHFRKEREQVQKQLQRIDEALAALGDNSNGTSRTMSAAGRRRIRLAQKARWAKQRTAEPKRTISAAGREEDRGGAASTVGESEARDVRYGICLIARPLAAPNND